MVVLVRPMAGVVCGRSRGWARLEGGHPTKFFFKKKLSRVLFVTLLTPAGPVQLARLRKAGLLIRPGSSLRRPHPGGHQITAAFYKRRSLINKTQRMGFSMGTAGAKLGVLSRAAKY